MCAWSGSHPLSCSKACAGTGVNSLRLSKEGVAAQLFFAKRFVTRGIAVAVCAAGDGKEGWLRHGFTFGDRLSVFSGIQLLRHPGCFCIGVGGVVFVPMAWP